MNAYIFSTHMVIHVLLLLVIAPLIVLSMPPRNWLKKCARFFQQWPMLCWFAGIGAMWFWHIPVVYRTLMLQPAVSVWSIAHVLSLLLAGMLFSWVVIGPYPQYRLTPLTGIFYLVTACIGCSLLGLLITFAPDGMYTLPGITNCGPGLAKTINNQWNLNKTADQQIAGLIMWVPGCFIYLTGVLLLLRQWFHEKEESRTLALTLQNT